MKVNYGKRNVAESAIQDACYYATRVNFFAGRRGKRIIIDNPNDRCHFCVLYPGNRKGLWVVRPRNIEALTGTETNDNGGYTTTSGYLKQMFRYYGIEVSDAVASRL